MKLIYERKNLTKSIPLMALMAAINIIVAELAGLSPIVSLFLILVLPLTSAVVELCCKDRYFPIYAVATFGLSLALTFWNIETTIFYVLPSIITGYIFGLLAKYKIPVVWSIIAATLAQTAMSYALIPLVNFIFQVDIILTFKTALGLKDMVYVDTMIPSFIFVISLIQVSLSQLIVSQELQKFGVIQISKDLSEAISAGIGLGISLLIIPFYFISLEFAYLFLMIALYFAIYKTVMFVYEKKYYWLIPIGVSIAINIVLVALLNQYLKEASTFLLLGFTTACICLISIVFSYLNKKKEKIQ